MMGNYHVRFDGGFREKVSIQTTRPFTYPTMVIEVEISGQTGLQLVHCVILVEIDVLVFDAGPVFQQLPYAGPNQVGINLVFTG